MTGNLFEDICTQQQQIARNASILLQNEQNRPDGYARLLKHKAMICDAHVQAWELQDLIRVGEGVAEFNKRHPGPLLAFPLHTNRF